MNPCKAAKLLLEKDNMLIITHKNPDGDTVGSASALCYALRREGKTAYLFENTEITKKYIEYAREFFAPEGFEPDYYISVDVAAPDMVCKGAPADMDLVIDHHPSNPKFGKENVVMGDKSSCGEIILDIIEKMPLGVDEKEADLLYVALSTDTGCFRYTNTNYDSYIAASKLVKYGADKDKLNLILFRRTSKARIMIESMIFQGMKFYHDGKVVISTITKEMMEKCGAEENDLDDIASLPGRIETEEIGITIREKEDGESKISMRSATDFDVSKVCAYFGGGGHRAASGCTISANTEKAAELIMAVLDDLWTATS